LESHDLHRLLHKYWGYSEFRPKQEAIVQAILGRQDVAVVMPTGGGKSLCYQLPAVAMNRMCVVVSPLIALMQDQAASMREIGIEAAFLNSTLDADRLRDVKRRAARGEFHLLYISPERIVREDMLAWLKTLPIGFFAIDEAHCISEWGHEFRPEYRQLGTLRERLPETPIAAFTASATRVVRHDILAQLNLRDPARFVMSFHRPNLRYIVRECGAEEQDRLLQAALDHFLGGNDEGKDEGNLILYAPTIRATEEISARLSARGVPVVPYHGRLSNELRQKNQELWMSGEARVLVGTVAFGLGINKPDVRAVVHLSLPKSLEQYYQEAGRAGRDGQPADCVLLWQKRDVGLLTHFVQQVQDARERERAWQRYHVMRRFVEQPHCRHRQICLHFGETPKWEHCGACDSCGVTLDWMQAEREVAVAAAVAERPHIGASAVRRKLARTESRPAGDGVPVNEKLRAALREWRRESAKTQSVPAFVILHDTTLEALCRRQPRRMAQLLEVPGIGERKAERFGTRILEIVAAFAGS
jgi:ATP-dependent DNA helicase RecQ